MFLLLSVFAGVSADPFFCFAIDIQNDVDDDECSGAADREDEGSCR